MSKKQRLEQAFKTKEKIYCVDSDCKNRDCERFLSEYNFRLLLENNIAVELSSECIKGGE